MRKDVLAEWLSFHFEREIEEFKRNAENDESGHGTVYNYHRDMEDNCRIAREDEDDDKDTFLQKALREYCMIQRSVQTTLFFSYCTTGGLLL